MKKYFVHDDEEGFQTFETEEEMFKCAGELISQRLGDDGWEEEVDNIVCGEINHATKQVNIRNKEDQTLDENNHDKDGYYWGDIDEICDYKMFPVEEEVKTETKSLVKTYSSNDFNFQAIQFTKESRLECLKFVECSASLENKGDVYTLEIFSGPIKIIVPEGVMILKDSQGGYYSLPKDQLLKNYTEVKS